MVDYQAEAISRVRAYSQAKNEEHQAFAEKFCKPLGVDVFALLSHILGCPITINFHPDRFSNNGKTIIENLLEQGEYHGQFRTGTTNGGRTAYTGGERFEWEQRIFFGAYPQNAADRPKYGALNLFRYIDGACVRFGSCFFTLKPEVINRCTFAYGDSSKNPSTLCTSGTFWGILAELFREYLEKGKALSKVLTFSSKEELLAVLLNPCGKLKDLGRNLDCCIETHIHGALRLDEDIESFYMDGSFQNTQTAEQAQALCKKYGISLHWILKRQLDVNEIGRLFRGAKIPLLAKKIDERFGKQGFINAELIGKASRDSLLHPDKWADIGNEAELFQYIKQLWHTVGYFG